MKSVSIVMPTLNRPAPLRRALDSLLAQTGLAGRTLEIIVADNSADLSAQATVAAIPTPAIPIRLVGVPAIGVANARNAGVAAAAGDWVAFLDDDEEAAPDWLSELLRVAEVAGADAAFGPVTARAESGEPMGDFTRFFERAYDFSDGSDVSGKASYLGANNSMFDKVRCLSGPGPFDLRLNQSGGEDSYLLMQLALDGRRFAYAAKARVTEWVPPKRLNWPYVYRRRFLSGQIRVFVLTMVRPVRWLAILKWTLVGLAQIPLAGLASMLLWTIGSPAHPKALASFYSGLGKLFWLRRWRPKLYGEGHVS